MNFFMVTKINRVLLKKKKKKKEKKKRVHEQVNI